ncbi:hypothetical protein F5882DRAFT_415623 [Hyaloscypha sp. PMI_1271]|nr:hypothetical protein F5882DRAFT_415623 [Hyaloscypha sp. PMI_1271]
MGLLSLRLVIDNFLYPAILPSLAHVQVFLCLILHLIHRTNQLLRQLLVELFVNVLIHILILNIWASFLLKSLQRLLCTPRVFARLARTRIVLVLNIEVRIQTKNNLLILVHRLQHRIFNHAPDYPLN